MTNVVSALTARTQLGQIIKRVSQQNERFVVDRRGQPSVVIMSIKDYIDTVAPAPRWLKDIQAASKRRGTDKLSMAQINSIVTEAKPSQSRKKKTNQPSR